MAIAQSAPATDIRGKPDSVDLVAAWSAQNSNYAELGQSINQLYLTLYNAQPSRLTVRIQTASIEKNAEELFRTFGLFLGPVFPLALDSLACDLNSHVCSRSLTPASVEKLKILTGHVGGLEPSIPAWNIRPGDQILVPAIRFEKQIRWVSYSSLQDKPLEAIVVNDLKGCATFDLDCKALILSYNRLEKTAEPWINFIPPLSLPLLTARAKIDVGGAKLSEPHEESLIRPNGNLVLKPEGSTAIGANTQYKIVESINGRPNSAQQKAGINDVIRQLDRHLFDFSKIRVDAGSDDAIHNVTSGDLEAFHSRLRSGINFPYSKLKEFPVDVRTRISVLVVDHWVDSDHCALKRYAGTPALKPLTVTNVEPKTVTPKSNCTESRAVTTTQDHGTHVAGLIGASTQTSTWWGLNPFADIFTVQITPEDSPSNCSPLRAR